MMNVPTGGEAKGIPEGSENNQGNNSSGNSEGETNKGVETNATTEKTEVHNVDTYYYKDEEGGNQSETTEGAGK